MNSLLRRISAIGPGDEARLSLDEAGLTLTVLCYVYYDGRAYLRDGQANPVYFTYVCGLWDGDDQYGSAIAGGSDRVQAARWVLEKVKDQLPQVEQQTRLFYERMEMEEETWPKLFVHLPVDPPPKLYARVEEDRPDGHIQVMLDGTEMEYYGKIYWGARNPNFVWRQVTGLVTEEELRSAIGRRRCPVCKGKGYEDGMHTMITGSTCSRCSGSGTVLNGSREIEKKEPPRERQTQLFGGQL